MEDTVEPHKRQQKRLPPKYASKVIVVTNPVWVLKCFERHF
jgi:hypothetical protein